MNRVYCFSRSNIVWYAISNFTKKGKEAIDFLCNSQMGEEYLRRFSKSLYLYVLNNFVDETLDIKYSIAKSKYKFDEKLSISNYVRSIFNCSFLHLFFSRYN